MDTCLSKEVEKLVQTLPFSDEIERLRTASEDYEKMLSDMNATKRGYNLMTSEEIHSFSSGCVYIQAHPTACEL